ncbi:glycosyltransferase family 2 protein [Nocardioides sp. 1609]|uniref:glycosyltransferase family 2 protein n=1 Tax=Nocardioides sp. 1609 TaxID=2508327 RepID=UPI00107000C7|nr:glycosyltransferase family 2 protein [Nocardioides sp. 1609]
MTCDVAVVVVAYNSADVVGDLLDSLPAALGGLVADVVVVDNGSADDTVAVLRARDDCRVVESTNTGYAGGINRGLRAAAAAPAYLVLNPDVRLDPDAVRPLLAALDRPGVGIAAPRVRTDTGDLHHSLRREPTVLRALGLSRLGVPALSEYVQEADAYERPGPVDWALGAVLAVSAACADAVGDWDESFFLYSEETDFCLRARDAGWATWFAPGSTAVHVGGASGRNDLTHTAQIINRVRLFRRRSGPAAGAAYFGLTVLSELTWVARGHHQSRASVRALLRPSSRPAVLGCGTRLVPL